MAKSTESIEVNDGSESTRYSVVVEVDTPSGPRWAYIEMEEAYEEEDIRKCLDYYRVKKTVDGYYFYSKEKRKVYFSKEIATAKEYMESNAKGTVELIIGIDLTILVAILLTSMFKVDKLPDIPGKWERDELIVCRYVGFMFGFLAAMCAGLGVALTGVSVHLLTNAGNLEAFFTAMLFPVLTLMMFAEAGMIVLFMRNFALVFYPEGVVFRDLFGKTWSFTKEEIMRVRLMGSKAFYVQTKEKSICVTSFGTNYYSAEEYVKKKYL